MDHLRPVDVQLSAKDMTFWKSRKEMGRLVSKIAGDTGRGMRIGDSTTVEISKRVGAFQLVIFMTVYQQTMRISGEIQLGLKDLFRDDWPTVKAYTQEAPHATEMFEMGLALPVFTHYGGGVKPYFVMHVVTDTELAFMVKRIFKVEL
jgi:hypothetical protein